jgi:O-antigen ligase
LLYSGEAETVENVWPKRKKEILSGAFFWLSAFYVVYCARPADFIPVLDAVPLAKITALMALLGLVAAAGKAPRRFKDLPIEASYLLALIILLFVSAVFSPVWRGGALATTLDFAKAYMVWVLAFMLVTTLKRMRRIIFIQSASVIVICFVAIAKGHSIPRLNGVVGGFYSNPNDMAFAIVLSLPFCLAFLLTAKTGVRKALWCAGMLVMATALVLTASRAGFIDLVVAGTACLWHFGVRGKRLYLIAATLFFGALLLLLAGRTLVVRFAAISEDSVNSGIEESAHESFEERKLLMVRAVEAIATYPILGVGAGNFAEYGGLWKDVHASYLQVAAEGGIPVLILYLMFFSRGFANLRRLSQMKDLDPETVLFLGALKGSLIGFVVGACFAPEGYQFFPYFTVCYTSVFLAIAREQRCSEVSATPRRVFTSPQRRLAEV